MKKLIKLILEMESDDETCSRDSWIRRDLEQEISCCSNYYELVSFETKEVRE